ncbi:MAG: YjjG family noncanonical pyrimidine nucleotidase [Bacteroidales bacterium]|jgi:putative hydrolase of the HAD superfamily|nr:YjjG family noncanonical pyrimidine nucleotidase [Bacteroidales bacterium]MDD2204810.1 YjjG family noncanonical pyrimidine nucleotidase [Bacteroidales bacterium]MDD3151836.1 YjjG family noncanonical pyrimidine nucleotidase [Bacteroidales bacterium]MDD3914007.1 YjjG family noncanonical pyrimidine nucleotidase [Bacteroidales bacterium]MDD4633857.1 YjjG family noncanonical pyrimidine nucleotidase [Bacteroidales bacterium]
MYKILFFDLDNTVWNFAENSHAALEDVFVKYNIQQMCNCNFADFYKVYSKHNDNVWELFRQNKMTANEVKSLRFLYTFAEFGVPISVPTSKNMNDDYLEILPTKKALFPDVILTLERLQQQHSMHIVSNGFFDVQQKKLRLSGLNKFFGKVITSETAGYKKPDPRIFEYAIEMLQVDKSECAYIGDEYETDMLCAHNAGIAAVWFNPKNRILPINAYQPDAIVNNFAELTLLFCPDYF